MNNGKPYRAALLPNRKLQLAECAPTPFYPAAGGFVLGAEELPRRGHPVAVADLPNRLAFPRPLGRYVPTIRASTVSPRSRTSSGSPCRPPSGSTTSFHHRRTRRAPEGLPYSLRDQGRELDVGVDNRRPLNVATVHRRVAPAEDGDVLLRHRPRSITRTGAAFRQSTAATAGGFDGLLAWLG